MKRRMLVVVLVGLLALGIAQGVLAFGPGGQMGGMGRMMGQQAANELGISTEQQKELTELQLQRLEKTQGVRLAHEKLKLELRDLWAEEPLDTEAIAAKEAELVNARIEMVEIHRELEKAAEEVLTTEQLEKIKAESWGQRRHQGGRGGRGRSNGMRQGTFSGYMY